MSSAEFSCINKRYWTEFTNFFKLLISRMAPWAWVSTHNLSHSSPRTADGSLLMPRRGVRLRCIKTKWLTLLTMSQCMVYVYCCTQNTTTHLTHCRRGLGCHTTAWNAKKHLRTKISTIVNQSTLVACVRKGLLVQAILHKIL